MTAEILLLTLPHTLDTLVLPFATLVHDTTVMTHYVTVEGIVGSREVASTHTD